MTNTDVQGKVLPLNKDDFQYSDWDKLTGTLGFAATELLDVANALESQNADWMKNCQSGIPDYYRTLAQNLAAIQQTLFGYNVTGNKDIPFK